MQLNENVLSMVMQFKDVPAGKTFWASTEKEKIGLFVKLNRDLQKTNDLNNDVWMVDDFVFCLDNVSYNVFDIRNNILCYIRPETEVIIVNGMFCFDDEG